MTSTSQTGWVQFCFSSPGIYWWSSCCWVLTATQVRSAGLGCLLRLAVVTVVFKKSGNETNPRVLVHMARCSKSHSSLPVQSCFRRQHKVLCNKHTGTLPSVPRGSHNASPKSGLPQKWKWDLFCKFINWSQALLQFYKILPLRNSSATELFDNSNDSPSHCGDWNSRQGVFSLGWRIWLNWCS